jgi:hypothetical protein
MAVQARPSSESSTGVARHAIPVLGVTHLRRAERVCAGEDCWTPFQVTHEPAARQDAPITPPLNRRALLWVVLLARLPSWAAEAAGRVIGVIVGHTIDVLTARFETLRIWR